MPSSSSEDLHHGYKHEDTVRQRSDSNRNWLSDWSSFDGISIFLVVVALLLAAVLAIGFSSQSSSFIIQSDVLAIAIALMSVVFTVLSVRESKRDREADVAPTLFVAERNEGEQGILNLGSGPAHELSVWVATTQPADWKEVKHLEGEILSVDEFLSLELEERQKWIKMEYRSNVGYKQYNVTRKVLLDNAE